MVSYFKMKTTDGMVDIMTKVHKYVPAKCYKEPYTLENSEVISISKAKLHPILFVEKYVNFSFYDVPKPSEDKKRGYAIEILSLGCFYLEYSDAIKEGDGKRVLRCWRYLLSIFYSSGRTNYANEVLRMLYQHDYILSPRHKTELLWGQFINVHGRTGKNIAADLHMEHLNRVVKECIKCLGANKTEGAIVRVGKALGTVVPVLDQFDLENDVSTASGLSNPVNAFKDHNMVANELSTHNIFKDIPHRKHAHI